MKQEFYENYKLISKTQYDQKYVWCERIGHHLPNSPLLYTLPFKLPPPYCMLSPFLARIAKGCLLTFGE